MFWIKQDEILGGRWIKIAFWRFFLLMMSQDYIICISKEYPPKSKDRGFAHTGERK